ncbi:hypothetical protein [Eoetvoesiella caeni]|uniref:hypothetical protein n=1 Tax=Eoetvoesiella caeni TaxID=645616 RepID=UPI000DE96A94|nr:hypothetical protein [Eoetvoesiella caeni]MCI2810001.1 hypothetical protein [Eoetvoesiella caeni]NYT55877.1 hypothetical protein [Eoetvoesiella caeni]
MSPKLCSAHASSTLHVRGDTAEWTNKQVRTLDSGYTMNARFTRLHLAPYSAAKLAQGGMNPTPENSRNTKNLA